MPDFKIEQAEGQHILQKLYGLDHIAEQSERYLVLMDQFQQKFSRQHPQLFSAPGRTEIGGNHTDHNHGRVLAASVNLDSIAAASKSDSATVTIYSEGFDRPFVVSLSELNMQKVERGTTCALIRGIAARFEQLGYQIGGFNACISSRIMVGSGLSSSASIEVLIGAIFNALFNNNQISAETLALAGQYAENEYFGKPCGLMDQIACAVGGIVAIDFENPQYPLIKKVKFDFSTTGYCLAVVDTGGNHADLTDDYAAVPAEMKAVAQSLQAEVCRELAWHDVLKNIQALRTKVGDRAVLRAMHFLGENERVLEQIQALENRDFAHFLELIQASGNSSFRWLQNCYSVKNTAEQGVTLALALTEHFLHDGRKGACRVHGGGFAGTIQVFLPENQLQKYVSLMESVFGKKSVVPLSIRPVGAAHLNTME